MPSSACLGPCPQLVGEDAERPRSGKERIGSAAGLLGDLFEDRLQHLIANFLADHVAAERPGIQCLLVVLAAAGEGPDPGDEVLQPHVGHVHEHHVRHDVVHVDDRIARGLVLLPLGQQRAPYPRLAGDGDLVEIAPDFRPDPLAGQCAPALLAAGVRRCCVRHLHPLDFRIVPVLVVFGDCPSKCHPAAASHWSIPPSPKPPGRSGRSTRSLAMSMKVLAMV